MTTEQNSGRPVTLVTGGGTGVGAATARLLAARGHDVVVAYHNSREAAESIAEACRAAGAASLTVHGDVQRDENCCSMAARAIERFGRLDCLVNNAGFTEPVAMSELEAITPEHFQRTVATNIVGPFQMTRAAAPHLAKTEGAVVNVSSLGGLNGTGSSIAYAASKGGLNTLTLSLARTLAPVRVNAVAPGLIATDWVIRTMGVAGFDAAREQAARTSALGGVCSPDDIAATIVWLLTSRTMTGEIIRIDAGFSLGR